MRTRPLIVPFILGVLGSIPADVTAQHGPGLYYLADIQEFNVIYTTPPKRSLSQIFFLGDTNVIRLQVQNASDLPASIFFGDAEPAAAFAVTAKTLPEGAEIPALSLPSEVEILGRHRPQHSKWRSEIQLQPHETAVWYATLIVKGHTVAGDYVLDVEPRFRGSPSPITLNRTRVIFELRDTTRQDDQVEQARRRLRHAHFDYVRGDRAAAAANRAAIEASARRLLTIYPDCADAYEILGLVAQREGSIAEARGYFQRALDFVRAGQDRLFVAHQDEATVDKKVQELEQNVRAVQ
jgi:tetratricopeptide (TPR) repeat protein